MERTTYYIGLLYILEWTHLAFTSRPTVALIKIWVKLQYSAKYQNKMVYCSYYLAALIIVNHWEYYHSIMKTTLSYYKNAHKLIRNSNCVSNFNWGCFMLFIFNDVNTLTLIHNSLTANEEHLELAWGRPHRSSTGVWGSQRCAPASTKGLQIDAPELGKQKEAIDWLCSPSSCDPLADLKVRCDLHD